jgi:predicted TIM-barrel fold metal-dependent hydrolase
MIIDCHGHYTTAPKPLELFRKAQIATLTDPKTSAHNLNISDDEVRETLVPAQLKLQQERGTDVAIFSPGAGKMAHHIGTFETSSEWSRVCNDLIAQVCRIYPKSFVGVCQLPQSPGVEPKTCVAELERCVTELGFIGCNLNPDPSGGYWKDPPLTDPMVVSALRKDGRARRAGDGACRGVVQSEFPRHRGALHQRRHLRLHAVPDLGLVQGFSDPQIHHPAWRWRGALSYRFHIRLTLQCMGTM